MADHFLGALKEIERRSRDNTLIFSDVLSERLDGIAESMISTKLSDNDYMKLLELYYQKYHKQEKKKAMMYCILRIQQMAEVFAKEGANLILCARSASTKQIADTLAEKYNIKAIYVNCDVTKKADCQNAVDKGMETFGQIDILVSNAGVCKLGNFLETDDNDRDFHFSLFF